MTDQPKKKEETNLFRLPRKVKKKLKGNEATESRKTTISSLQSHRDDRYYSLGF